MAIFNSFTFGDTSSLGRGIVIERKDVLNSATPDMEEYSVPGRDGTVYRWNKRFQNVTVEYETFLKVPEAEDLPRFTGDLKRWLLANPGEYRRLTDTYDPDHYRLAVYAGGLEMESEARRYTRQTVSFSCLPYRYRKTGETELSLGTSGTLMNDTGFDSLPLLRIGLEKGSQTAVNIRVDYEDGTAYAEALEGLETDQDSAILDCGQKLIFEDGGELIYCDILPEFPTLKPGENKIAITGQRVTDVTVTPRWREL